MANYNGKLITGKTILKTAMLISTAISFGAQLFNTWGNKKLDEIEMHEAVQKEVRRQMLIPMKTTDKRDP